MEFFSQESILAFLSQYAYAPEKVYFFVIVFMILSGFGLPIPEEVVLVSCGIIGHMAMSPDLYPPPVPGLKAVDPYSLATVCFFAVLMSDTLVYSLGRFSGGKIFSSKLFKKFLTEDRLSRVNKWFQKYGSWAVIFFRFTPGIRFPGHLSCGMMGFPLWKFLLIDAAIALISVPTQVILVSNYGEIILGKLKEFKIAIAIIFLIFLAYYFIQKFIHYRNRRLN